MNLIVENLSCARGGVPVLQGLSFSVQAGQALVLRGPNGAGKTTLLRTLAGLQPALAGNIATPPEEIALASHTDGVKGVLTVAENLKFWADIYGMRDIAAAMAAMNLSSLQTRVAGQLSAGQRRRLGLARLLVTGRKIWLLDEPTVSLDAASVTLFADLIGLHIESGGLAIIATHVDLGLRVAETLDLTPFKARLGALA